MWEKIQTGENLQFMFLAILWIAISSSFLWFYFGRSENKLYHTKSFRVGVITLLIGITLFCTIDISEGIGLMLTGLSVIFLRDGISKS